MSVLKHWLLGGWYPRGLIVHQHGELSINSSCIYIVAAILLPWHQTAQHLVNAQLSSTNKGASWPWSYGSWIYNYLCNQCLSPLMLWVRSSIRARCTTLCDKFCQWLATGRRFSLGTSVSSTKKNDRRDITEILLKVALNTTKQTNKQTNKYKCTWFPGSFIDIKVGWITIYSDTNFCLQ